MKKFWTFLQIFWFWKSLILLKIVNTILLPNFYLIKYFHKKFSDPEGSYENTKAILAEMDIKNYKHQDLIDVRYVAEIVSVRSASLVGAGIATLLNKMEISPVTVGIDGSVYRQHPKFRDVMLEKIKCIVKPEIEVHNQYFSKITHIGTARFELLKYFLTAFFNYFSIDDHIYLLSHFSSEIMSEELVLRDKKKIPHVLSFF